MFQTLKLKELQTLCKEKKISYSGKKKQELIDLLSVETINSDLSNLNLKNPLDLKKEKGQFYTVNSDYILEGFSVPKDTSLIEPFAGKGDLIEWCKKNFEFSDIEKYDIDPKYPDTIQQDTLQNLPNYKDKFVITNPPYLARNKCNDKTLFDKYDTNDLYKCFIHSISDKDLVKGGILIIPAGFFFSPRDLDIRCRNAFLSNYKITRVNYFEETVFPDTPTTVVSFQFEKSEEILITQDVLWVKYPSKEEKIFTMSKENDWIIGGDIYKLDIPENNNSLKIKRYIEGQELKEGYQILNLTLNALDSGKEDGRISLDYKENFIYKAKDTSRTYATLCLYGKILTNEEQKDLSIKFNEFVNQKRKETWSLFLPQFRESKEYARKRIPFELAYDIVLHLI